ncbi:DUF4959 domain-containing protein [Sphingobacterium sp. SGG-5]|uniref:DUF5000 domain-containing lipoprotein n=1 Tax=Sphingobacterium sp. SGG-5 TaxID=2710881 RepID=UPI0013EBBF28|nr:DUF5000 domain-containing lipoprotein [Sphingobacterium sp. SGG-5]NGM61534.1 DUF4959 domain-containing protein [Sphingobacterium sp. SGG-5]
MKSVYILNLLLGALLIVSCSPEKFTSTINDDTAPGPVKSVQVENLPGAAKISYVLPNDESLRYVKAVYAIRPGVEREAKASLYADNLIVDGFPEEKEYEVTLYAVSKGEKESEPVKVKINPLTSPLSEAYNSLTFEETFGGATVAFSNSGGASLSVKILTQDNGTMSEIETYYTKSIEGKHSVRGFAAEPRVFAAIIRDRWGNLSDTISTELTPIFEEQIPKDKFVELHLPTDTYEKHIPQGDMFEMWNDRIAPNGGIGVFHTKPGSGMPQWFTFDMGRMAIFSRYKLWHRGPGQQWAYQAAAPKRWEVYGTAETPDPEGSWDGWTLLMECESYKPSGDGPITQEDALYATSAGEDFIFPDDMPPVRYLRFKILETWGFLDYIYIQELTFWGQLQ